MNFFPCKRSKSSVRASNSPDTLFIASVRKSMNGVLVGFMPISSRIEFVRPVALV